MKKKSIAPRVFESQGLKGLRSRFLEKNGENKKRHVKDIQTG
jgi:hypothetical protein